MVSVKGTNGLLTANLFSIMHDPDKNTWVNLLLKSGICISPSLPHHQSLSWPKCTLPNKPCCKKRRSALKWKYSEKEFSESKTGVEPMSFQLAVGYVSRIQEPNWFN